MLQTPHRPGQTAMTPGSIGQKYSVSADTACPAILSDIVADDKRAVQVIESLRLMLRRQATARKPMDLCDIVHDVVGLLHTELVRQGVQLELPLGAAAALMDVQQAIRQAHTAAPGKAKAGQE